MVVGIIGVETYYGRHMGKFSVLDVLTTLSLDFPTEHPRAAERQAFFQDELGHFLRQTRQGASIKRLGSYAGAMGWPQFMPSSWSKYAVDFDRTAKWRWNTHLCCRHPQLLRGHPLQLEQLLRHGGDRVGVGGERASEYADHQ